METNQIFQWLKTLPFWLRCVVLILIAALVVIASMSLSACGTTHAVVRNSATDTVTEIKITTNNPTSVQASPNVQIIPKN